MPTFAPFQLPLNSLPDEVGSLFALLQNLVYAAKGALWKAGRRLFVIDLFASHSQRIDDITKCYKPHFSRYHLLTIPEYLISSKTSEREREMTVITIQKAAQGWTAEFRGSDVMPNGVALPLPFTGSAPAEMVRADLRSRFPGAAFVTKANSR